MLTDRVIIACALLMIVAIPVLAAIVSVYG